MNTTPAGEKKFSAGFDFWWFRCYWWERVKVKTHKKLNITLPLELHSWVVQRQREEQKKTRIAVVPLSKIIADCVEKTMQREKASAIMLNDGGNPSPQPHTGAVTLNPRRISAGGSKTLPIRYPTKRQARSSK